MGRSKTKRSIGSTTKRGTLTGAKQRRMGRYAKQLAIWRYTEDGETTKPQDNVVFRGFVPAVFRWEAFKRAQLLTWEWQCVFITYCRDPWGKEYHLLGESRSQPIKAEEDGIRPIIEAAWKKAEESANTKHIYARGCVFAPISKEYPTLTQVFDNLREELHLTDDDIIAIAEFEREDSDIFEYDRRQVTDLDTQIAALLGSG